MNKVILFLAFVICSVQLVQSQGTEVGINNANDNLNQNYDVSKNTDANQAANQNSRKNSRKGSKWPNLNALATAETVAAEVAAAANPYASLLAAESLSPYQYPPQFLPQYPSPFMPQYPPVLPQYPPFPLNSPYPFGPRSLRRAEREFVEAEELEAEELELEAQLGYPGIPPFSPPYIPGLPAPYNPYAFPPNPYGQLNIQLSQIQKNENKIRNLLNRIINTQKV